MAEEKDIETLYSKVNKLDSRMTKIESTRPFLEDMIRRNVGTNEKLVETLQEVQISMVKMNEKMDEQSMAIAAMKQEFEVANAETHEKIEAVDKRAAEEIAKVGERVEEVEEKGKFDIHLFIKSNWPWILILLGVGFYTISKFVKF